MYFKFFNVGANTNTRIEKAGFQINTLDETKTFYGDKTIHTGYVPKDYLFDGSVWEAIDISTKYERLILLVRQPVLSFDELWGLFHGKDKDDSFGALIVMLDSYLSEILNELKHIKDNQKTKHKNKLLEIKKYCNANQDAISKQIVAIISEMVTHTLNL